nr:retrovirus-related Pol polyprotein from transposon TNT 1-94 [Tanacetum cinerariifolium]
MAVVEVPHTLEFKGGQLNAAPVLEVENFTNWKKMFMCHIIDKSTWDDLILYHEGPSDVKESKVMDLKLCYNTFTFKEDSPDDEEDTRSSHEYLNDLEEEYQARAFLAKSKRFFKKDTQRFSSAKATDQTECHKYGKKGLITEAYEWDEEEVSSDDNEMVEVKVLMALAEDNDAVKKEGVQNADDTKVSIPGVERPWLSKVEGFILPNYDTGRILPNESQRNTTDPLVAVNDSLTTDYDSADEYFVHSTLLPPLKKLDGGEPISGPKTIKSILRSKSTFKAKTLKGVIINEPSSALAKDNKNSLA